MAIERCRCMPLSFRVAVLHSRCNVSANVLAKPILAKVAGRSSATESVEWREEAANQYHHIIAYYHPAKHSSVPTHLSSSRCRTYYCPSSSSLSTPRPRYYSHFSQTRRRRSSPGLRRRRWWRRRRHRVDIECWE